LGLPYGLPYSVGKMIDHNAKDMPGRGSTLWSLSIDHVDVCFTCGSKAPPTGETVPSSPNTVSVRSFSSCLGATMSSGSLMVSGGVWAGPPAAKVGYVPLPMASRKSQKSAVYQQQCLHEMHEL